MKFYISKNPILVHFSINMTTDLVYFSYSRYTWGDQIWLDYDWKIICI